MHFDVLTLFPEVFDPYLKSSILGRAQTGNHISVGLHNIRSFTTDKHHTTDDTPYGGGAGMVMKIEPIDRCLDAVKTESSKKRTVVLSARGRQFTQAVAQEYASLDQLILICGRYEGIDQRVTDHLADEELSIGPYVLAGGELAALVVIEAVARLIPGVLGNPDSLTEESFNLPANKLIKLQATQATIEYPQYTKPEDYKGWKVPKILLSGDHGAIAQWRAEQRRKTHLQ